ncbi:MAG TPA: hypothetical protein HPP64_12390 [Gammaproteobacteria bacterium]|jgi:hypothetical protein|nr:hypothetical protein [Candidatus Neomarinimicrobiota bacterium]HIJ23692.1 hypothetical protein [Gammaproteobacteria bacterium]HIJ29464.1 hypothetical protein [Gammaproteobacteria bacterium]HIJ31659.1 hypothetical protein [Gammaproteobacteria bacterium]
MVINLKTEHWTEDQVWALYQLVDQLYNHLHENHGETIQYCEWREEQLEEQCNYLMLEEKEREEMKQWLDRKWRSDPEPIPF